MNSGKKTARVFSTAFMILAFFAIAVPTAQAEMTEEWVAQYNKATRSDLALAMAIDDSTGNVYVTGYSYDFETYSDYSTVAYDSSGNQLWVASYNGTGNSNDRPSAIATDDSTGNVYVTGYSFGLGTHMDYATVAYDSLGNQLWVARYNGPASPGNSYDEARAIATDSAGNIYVTGASFGQMSAYDYATVAYDSLGNQLWVARYSSTGYGYDLAKAIAIDSAGNIYVTGDSSGGIGYTGYATVAYDSFGNQLWATHYNGPDATWDYTSGIAIDDSTGNVYVTGYSYDFETLYDFATVAYDSSGNQLWVARYNGSDNSHDSATAIATNNAGNVYVTGYSPSLGATVVAYDSLGNQLWVASYTGPAGPSQNVLIPRAIDLDSADNIYVTGDSSSLASATVAFDSFGNLLWEAPLPLNGFLRAIGIAIDSADNVYVSGNSIRGTGYTTIKYSQEAQNNPPLAEAGVTQTVECSRASGTIYTLDGSGSTDPDGDELTYIWSGPFGTKMGEVATVTLPLGTHIITLMVDDGRGGTATDNVEIRVEDTTPPVVTKVILSGNELLPGLYLSDVLFEIEATDSCSGVANVSFDLDTTQTSVSGSYASATISSGGDHAIAYEALDNAGNVSVGGSLAFSLFEANASGLGGLIDYFLAQGLINSQMETSLNMQATTGNYGAFINHVEAQSGKKIDPVAAQVLIEAAQSIMGN